MQAMKAGILEIAHIVVVNKADHQDTNATIQALQEWVPKILPTVAIKGEGIQSVVESITTHQDIVKSEKQEKRKSRRSSSPFPLFLFTPYFSLLTFHFSLVLHM